MATGISSCADQAVDPGIVVIDQLAELVRDGMADLGHARQSAQAGAELLDRLQLGGPGRHPLVVLGGPDRDARLGRQRGDRLELVFGPVMRAVVIDVEQAEQVRAIHQRRRAQRVEPLLDHRGSDVLAARVIPVLDREQRPSQRHRRRRERSRRKVADAGQIGGRQAAADVRDHMPVAVLEEDRGPVALEQDHGVVDEAGQDPVEVESAADVAGHAAQRLGTVEEVGDLLGASRAAHDGAEAIGGDARDLEIVRTDRADRLADDQQDAPRPLRARDDHRQLGATIGQDRQGRVLVGVGQEETGQRQLAGARAPGGQAEGPSQDAVSARQVDQSMRAGDVDPGEGSRRQSVAAQFPGGDQVMTVGVADGPDRREQGIVGILAGVDEPADGRGERSGRAGDARHRAGRSAVTRAGRDRPARSVPRRPGRSCVARPTCRWAPAAPRRAHRSRPRQGTAGGRRPGSAGRLAD